MDQEHRREMGTKLKIPMSNALSLGHFGIGRYISSIVNVFLVFCLDSFLQICGKRVI